MYVYIYLYIIIYIYLVVAYETTPCAYENHVAIGCVKYTISSN